eukprot:1161803-Pelagomonas_calceolata.AAC.11
MVKQAHAQKTAGTWHRTVMKPKGLFSSAQSVMHACNPSDKLTACSLYLALPGCVCNSVMPCHLTGRIHTPGHQATTGSLPLISGLCFCNGSCTHAAHLGGQLGPAGCRGSLAHHGALLADRCPDAAGRGGHGLGGLGGRGCLGAGLR